ncbi:hypothetical protein BAS06_15755 [Elizabethkingia miricola]|uniref:sacsin N-terminal ATP-binding-like domain-containing protein n=1 Tax=Elizabethkingia miricola TaxID=172045 RepID=UPI000999DBF5|nr:hypothetical protein [Elizabethkingia miricola]OPB86650.1 hypothetical protein BAS06_15755 [Elizabethkingia miricola]
MSKTEGIFQRYERDELNKITAKSILEKLMNIRQKIDTNFTARRLVWELIQNAKDNVSLCNKDQDTVDIVIEMNENNFVFSHNKGFFNNEHVRGLIRKYSSSDKNRDSDNLGHLHKITGRFGTGFMTTHLLSEKVQVNGYYNEDSDGFYPFDFWIDRSGKGEREIVQGINSAFEEVEKSISKSEEVILDMEDLNTSFTYPIVDQKKKDLAEIAMEEVAKGIAYTLINVPEINSIKLIDEWFENSCYTIKEVETILYEGCDFTVYNLQQDGVDTEKYYVNLWGEEIQITIPVSCTDGKYTVLKLDNSIPRLHLDFPMIGTEDLNLPFIINSSLFEPTEPRDGISLIYDDDNEISKLNCDLVLKAINLYRIFLSYVEENDNWYALYNLARVSNPKRHSWIDYEWYKASIVEPLRTKLLHTKLVDVYGGDRISIQNDDNEDQVYFPYANKNEERDKIWELLKQLYPQSVPIKDDIDHWYEVIWGDCCKFSIESLSSEIENRENIENLSMSLDSEEEETISFLNKYYNLLNLEGNHIKDIVADKYSVIPNQLGYFKKKTELKIDKDIDDEIKAVCAMISVDPREYLIRKMISTGGGIKYEVKKQENIVVEINSIIKENNHDRISDACDYLASLFVSEEEYDKRDSIFEFSKRVFPEDFTERRRITFYDPKIWEESDKKSLFYIVSKIASCKTIEGAVAELSFNDEEEFISWLDSLITFLVKEGFENNINREKHPILPNQNGKFCSKENLFLDDDSMGDDLKDISAECGYDFREELLDKGIFLQLPENRTYGIGNVTEKISSFVKPILRGVDERKAHKGVLKKIYSWMNENKELANSHLFDLFEKRFLFLEDDDISQNIKKASELDMILEEYNIESIDELRSKLDSQKKNINTFEEHDSDNDKIHITKEIMASLGISSQEELENIFRDPFLASRFHHISTSNNEMLLYSQKLIQRAKENIIHFLKNHPDYDCTDLEEIAPTVLAGIEKNGIPINVVFRPSDNQEIILYYSSENATLDSTNSEFWVDNGIDDPHILTLGRILKSIGINRIPLNMN